MCLENTSLKVLTVVAVYNVETAKIRNVNLQDSLIALANDVGDLATKSGSEATEKVDEAEQKAKAANDKYLRLNADFDNFRKRSVSTTFGQTILYTSFVLS